MPDGIKKVFQGPVTQVDTTDLEEVGTIRFEGNKIYKYVKLYNDTATAAVVVGDALCYASPGGYESNTVVMDLNDAGSSGSIICAGCATGTVTGTVDTAYYIWVQIKGTITTTKDLPGTADGKTVTMSDASADGTLVAQNAATEQTVGIISDESANTLILDCPF